MKPIYQSKKFWTAIMTLLAVVAAHYKGDESLTFPITTIGGLLIVGFGLADNGKEAAALKAGK